MCRSQSCVIAVSKKYISKTAKASSNDYVQNGTFCFLGNKACILTTFIFVLIFNTTYAALKPRWTPPKPEHTVLDDNCYKYCITIKFLENSCVRLRDDSLVSLTGYDLKPFYLVLNSYKIKNLKRLFSRPEHLIDEERETGQQRSGKQLGDLNNYYRAELDSSENPEAFIDDLNSLNIIEITYAQPHYGLCDDIPPETPDFSDRQGYLYEAPDGIDAVAAWEQIGGRGENVKIIFIEGGCDREHEDLKELFYYVTFNSNGGDHGTAMLGTIIGGHNEYGVNGISPEASVGLYSVYDSPHDGPDIINICSENINEGDIIICVFGYNAVIPCEYIQASFDAIETATANGRVFIEVAGNSNIDLDDERYEGRFDPEERHSGAILVGAGAPPVGDHGEPRSRIEFSNYGSRLDIQGWGAEIVTCGYGDLFNPNDERNQRYTSDFGGTCGASAIVAGAVACLQGICKTRSNGHLFLLPEEVRNILVETGTPQNEEEREGHIGPQPDLAEAIEQIHFPFGYLFGNVRDDETNQNLEGVLIMTPCEEVVTDENGNWLIEETIALDEFTIAASLQYYNDSIIELDFEEGDTTEVNFSMLHPEFDVSIENISERLDPDSTADITFNIRNVGNGTLDWNAEKHLFSEADIDPWELRRSYPAGLEVDDNRLQGVIYDNNRFYITGGEHETNYIYILNRDGDLVNSFPQPGSSSYGMKDIAWDGELIWGSVDRMIYGFTTDGDSATCWEGPHNANNALTWDNEMNLLWIAGTSADYIAGYDREGNEQDSLSGYGFRISGLAYWADDPGGYNLYVFHNPSEDRQVVHKINTDNGDALFVAELTPERGGRPGGAFITNQMDLYSWVFIALSNNADEDRIDIWQLDRNMDWFNLNTSGGTIEADTAQELTLTFNASNLRNAIYEGNLLFRHNAAGDSVSIDLNLVVGNGKVTSKTNPLPSGFEITSIYPNPFNSSTRIVYNLNSPVIARLQVFDLTGRKVATLVEGYRNIGTYNAIWNAEDFPSGLYIVRLKTQDKERFRKLLLVK